MPSNELHPELEKYRAFPAQEAMEDDILIPEDEALAAQRAIERSTFSRAHDLLNEKLEGHIANGTNPDVLASAVLEYVDALAALSDPNPETPE